MVCSCCGILRAVSSLLKRFFFACVVTWELLGNIHSEELEGYIISRVQTECAVCWGAEVPMAGEAEVAVSGGRFRHTVQDTVLDVLHHRQANKVVW